MLKTGGLAVRVQGMKRFYAFEFVAGGKVQLLKALDGDTVLAETAFGWEPWRAYSMAVQVNRNHIRAWLDDNQIFDFEDVHQPLACGGIGLIVEDGHITTDLIEVGPVGED